MGTQASKISLGVVAHEQPQLNATRREWIIQDDRRVTVDTDYHLFGIVKDQLRGQRYEQRRQFRKQCVSAFGWLERNFTKGEFSNYQNAGRNVYKEVAIMWKNKERSVD